MGGESEEEKQNQRRSSRSLARGLLGAGPPPPRPQAGPLLTSPWGPWSVPGLGSSLPALGSPLCSGKQLGPLLFVSFKVCV